MEVLNTPELIRMQLSQIDSNITQLKLHLETIEAIGEDTGEKTDNIQEIIDQLNRDKIELETKLNKSLEVKNIFNNNLDIPKFSDKTKSIEWTLVYPILKAGVTGQDKYQFQSCWNIIKTLARNHNYSEENVDSLWQYCLDGEARFYYESKRNLTFNERISALLQLYSPLSNIRTKLSHLKSLKRLKGQTIKQFLSRLDFLLEETAASVKPELREGRRIHIIEENLMKAVSPNVREKHISS